MSQLKTIPAYLADDGTLFKDELDAHRHNAHVAAGVVAGKPHGELIAALSDAAADKPESEIEDAVTKLYTAFYLIREANAGKAKDVVNALAEGGLADPATKAEPTAQPAPSATESL